MRESLVFRLPMRHPADVAPLRALIASRELHATEIVAVLGKTEGNGCVNDFTRAYAADSLRALLAELLGVSPETVALRVPLVMSGGTEGGLSPHMLVLGRRASYPSGRAAPALAIGAAITPVLRPEQVGRTAQIEATARAVRLAMRDADITAPADVHFVQVKCPLLTSERVAEAAERGEMAATADTYVSMALSRAASALGVAVALGEIDAADLDDTAIGRRLDLWSGRASASSGIELMHCEVVVLGQSAGWTGPLRIGHAVMRDAIDLSAVLEAAGGAGLAARAPLEPAERDRVVAVLAKAEPSWDGRIRGLRHIMLDDSDIHATRHARALVGGVIAGLVGRTDLFVSGGAEHQGPAGGGPVAIIARSPGAAPQGR